MKLMGFFSIKYRYSDILFEKHKLHLSRLFCCNHTCYCVNMISVTSSIKYRYSDILFEKHKLHLSRLFCCNHTCYCVNMISVTSSSRYIMSASHYHPRYQSRSSMYIRGLIPRNFVELAGAVQIDSIHHGLPRMEQRKPLINAYTDVSSEARGLNFDLSLHLHPYFMHASNEGSGTC